MSVILPRERLFHLLDRGLDRPVTWVQGPGGSGKSTLVASYLDYHKLQSIWYQVDNGDADIATLFYYMGLAAKKAAPHSRHPLPLFTPEYQLGIATFARRYFENLFARLKPPYVLVLDDYHEVGPDFMFHDVVKHALTEVPHGISVIVISRMPPPPAMARLCAGKQMSFVGWDELQLTAEETAGIVRLHDRATQWQPVLDRLHDRVQGWVAGLVLLLERGTAGELEQWLAGKGPQQDIFNYFAGELFDRAEARLRDFLLKTALLPTITPDVAQRLTENPDAPRILAELHSSNFFTEKRTDREVLYRFHPLFREYLLNKAEQTYDPDQLTRLRGSASVLLEESGRIEEAAALCIDAEEWERLAGLILEHAQGLIAQGRNQTVLEWLENLPSTLLDKTPYLLFWLGTCRMTSSFPQARGVFEKAYRLFETQREPAGLYLTWAGIVDSIVYEWADFSRLDIWIEELNGLTRQHPQFPSKEIEGRVAGSMFGALMFHMPQHPEIEGWADRILTLARSGDDPAYRIMVGNQLALYHLWWTGNHTKLDVVMDLLRPPDNGERLPALPRIIWTTLKGLKEWASGLCVAAQRTFLEGLRLVQQSGVHVWDFMLYFQGIVSYLSNNDHVTGGQLLEELIGHLDRSQHLNLAHYYYVAAWQASLAGEPERALEQAQVALETTKTLGGPFTQAAVMAAWSQALHLCGRHEEACAGMAQSIELAREIKSPLLLYRNLMVKAHFALVEGNEAGCLATLQEALPIGSQGRYTNFSWWQESVMTPLCMKALEADIEVEYVKSLINKRGLYPAEPPLHLENWPWPIRIFTLGRFAIEIDGKSLDFPGKVQKKPLELLKALIAFGSENVPEGRLCDALWPDAEGDGGRSTLKVTLSRLRDLLGSDRMLRHQDGRLFLDRSLVWIDVRAHGELLDRAQEKGEAGDEADAVRCTEMALKLYRGHFLAGESDRPWMVSLRKRLSGRFVLNTVLLATLRQKHGDHRNAIEIYLRGLEIEELAEELYQNLMTCYHAAGLGAEAASTYQRCRLTLAVHGLKPSEKTQSLHRSLVAD
jgi:DNA-binding SARP family transcriptional activator